MAIVFPINVRADFSRPDADTKRVAISITDSSNPPATIVARTVNFPAELGDSYIKDRMQALGLEMISNVRQTLLRENTVMMQFTLKELLLGIPG